jgi:hypothetical protein
MKAIDKLNEQWNENPMTVIAVGALASTALAKLITAVGGYRSQNAYARQINFKIKNKK